MFSRTNSGIPTSGVLFPQEPSGKITTRLHSCMLMPICFGKLKREMLMGKINVIVIAGLACVNFVVFGQEYELEALTVTRASRLVAESEDGATNLILPHVSSIDAKTAKELAKAPHTGLILNGLSSMGEDTAHELAQFSGFVLALNGLTTVGPRVAQKLAAFEGRALVLSGLTAVNENSAAELVKFNGYALFLDGLIKIDKEVAEELATFRGDCLGLYGIRTIDEQVMRILVQWRGKKLSIREEGLTTKARHVMGTSERSWEKVGDVWASF